MRRRNDMLWKGILEDTFDDLLRFLFPYADKVFDMQRGFEFLDKELAEIYPLPEDPAQTRFVDKLVKVYLRNGDDGYFLVHVEVQGTKDHAFAWRMFEYYYRIRDRHRRRVTAIAIFTGSSGKDMPVCYEEAFYGTQLLYRYNSMRCMDYKDDVLMASENPFAVVMLAAKKALLAGKVPELVLKDEKLLIARLLLEKGIWSKKKVRSILTFLNNCILFEKPETSGIFIKELNEFVNKNYTMGIEEQIQEINKLNEEKAKKASVLFVNYLLENTKHSEKEIASIANVSISFVRKQKKA